MAVYPVPTSRSSGLLVQERLLRQMQNDQVQLLRLQSQLSTGRRVLVPSDDAPAAVRGMTLQRLLELKAQTKVNITTTQSYVAAADTTLGSVSDVLNDVRGLLLSAADSTAGAEERDASRQGVLRAIDQLVALGNTQFRDRYLFSGSRTNTQPFATSDKYVIYNGNDGVLRSFATLESLFDANVSGNAAFGAYSQPSGSSVDLNPMVTEGTLLTDLRSGRGITPGSIAVSDGNTTRTIDISSARTVGDVAALIHANPPAGRTVTARVTNNGLWIDLDDAGGGNLSIREVGNGTTAAELGILNDAGSGGAPIVGGDLNPQLKLTTQISELLGSRAIAYLGSSGGNNDLVLRAKTNGAGLNGVTLQFVDDDLLQAAPGLAAGGETVTYSGTPTAARAAVSFSGFNNNLVLTAAAPGTDFNNVKIEIADAGAIGNAATVAYNAATKTLTIGVDATGATEIQTVIDEIAAEGTFTAAYDGSSAVDGGYVPTALVQAADIGIVTGNTGNSGGAANTIFVNIDPGVTNANHALAALQGSAAVTANFDVSLDGGDTSSAGNAGLGIIDVNAAATTASGSGEDIDLSGGLRIVQGPNTYDISLAGVQSVEDLLNAVNGSGAVVLAEISADGAGIQIRSRLAGADFSVGENGGQVATQLGVRSFTAQTQLNDLNHGRGVQTAAGADLTIIRSDGTQLAIDLNGATTIQDVLDRINNDAANVDPANRVNAQLAAVGNGIELVESPAGGPGVLTVQTNFGSSAAVDLGLIPKGQTQVQAAAGAIQSVTGRDVNPQEVDSVFDTLIRMTDAIDRFDLAELERLDGKLNADLNRALYSRSDLGARGQSLDAIQVRLEDEQLQLKDSLSKEIEADIAEVISSMYAKQASLQASLQLMSRTFELTLLNYL